MLLSTCNTIKFTILCSCVVHAPGSHPDGGEDSCEQQRLRVELANLQERLGDTEQELDMERNRGQHK